MCDLIAKIVFIMLFFSSVSFAEIYKWTDDDGNIHYSESPPLSNQTVEEITPTQSVDTTDAGNKLQEQIEFLDARREARLTGKKEKEKEKADAIQQQEKCQQLNQRLTKLTTRPRANKRDAEGNIVRMGEEERQEEIKQTQRDISEQCNQAGG